MTHLATARIAAVACALCRARSAACLQMFRGRVSWSTSLVACAASAGYSARVNARLEETVDLPDGRRLSALEYWWVTEEKPDVFPPLSAIGLPLAST
jgi:hypothetical protein